MITSRLTFSTCIKSYDVGKNPTSIPLPVTLTTMGSPDLLTSNIAANSLSLLFGNGDGSFEAQVKIRVCKEPRNLALEDFNQDSHLDLAIACSGSDQVAIWTGQGDGTFEKVSQYHVNRAPVSIAAGDFNEDQLLDIVVALRNDKIQLLFREWYWKVPFWATL